jgi:hypothetical protein
MATTNSTGQVIGLFKTVFEKSGLSKNVPSFAILQDRIGLSPSEMLGDFYQVGVQLTGEHGTTYASSQNESVAPTLNAAVASTVLQMQVPSFQQITRSRLSYAAAAKAASKGEKAFEQAYGFVLQAMKEMASKKLELSLLYGQLGMAKISANSSGTLTITDATWSPGTWAGMVGAVLEAWTGVTATETQHNGDLTVSAISLLNKTVTVTGSSGSVVANDILYLKGSRTSTAFNEGPGIMNIIRLTSGTVFNINIANYDTMQAQQYSVNGAFSFTAIITGAMQAYNYGLSEDVVLLCAPRQYAVLASDEAALRRYDSSYSRSEGERGNKALKFHTGTGSIEILPHPYVREQEAGLIPFDYCRFVGASKLTAGLPGIGDLAVQVTDVGAVELRMFADMSPCILKPALCVYFYNIT